MDFSTQLLDHQVTAILLLDDLRNIHYANPAAEQLFHKVPNVWQHILLITFFSTRNSIYLL